MIIKIGLPLNIFSLNQIKSTENIVLSENGALVKDEEDVANIFNNFFVNIVPNLVINTQHEFLNFTDNSQDSVENAICKYENHPSIISINKYMEGANLSFVFEIVTKEKIEILVTNLNIRKAVQSNDIPTKLVKEFDYYWYVGTNISRCITQVTFVNPFKKAKVQPIYKKDGRIEKSDPLAFFQMLPKFMRDVYTSKYIPILIKYFLKINAVFVKDLTFNISF